MKPLACEARPDPREVRPARPRLPLRLPVIPVRVLRTVSISAPEPDVRPLPLR